MGKGNRNDRQRMENQSANEERFLQKKKAQQSKTRTDKIIAAACIVIALVVVAILVLNVFSETGVFMRIQPVMQQGDTTIDQAMMTFYVNDFIGNWYSDYLEYFANNYYYFLLGYYPEVSLNLNQDLKTQKITQSDVQYYVGDTSYLNRTWYDYFYDQIVPTMERLVTYANAAKLAKLSLSAEDREEIDEIIKGINEKCKKSGVSISEVYGKGVSESDIRKYYEMAFLAAAFEEHKTNEIKAYLSTTEGKAEIEKYPEDHKEDYYFVKYLSYSQTLSEKNFKTQQDYDKAVDELKAAMDKISKANGIGNFVDLIEEYKKNPVETGNKETTTESGTKAETELKTESETVDLVDKYTETIYYETDDELGKWLFDESEPVEKGDVNIIEETGTETEKETTKPSGTKTETDSESGSDLESDVESDVKDAKAGAETDTADETGTEDESGTENETGSSSGSSSAAKKTYKTFTITVYMVLKPSGLDMENTHNFGYVITNDREAAVKFLASFKSLNKEDRSRDKFKEMAEAYYKENLAEHDHTEADHVEPLFAYDSVYQGKAKYFSTSNGSDYAKVDAWLDSADRINAGEHGEIIDSCIEFTVGTGDSKQTLYAVLYFEDHHSQAWRVDAFNDVLNDKFADWYDNEPDVEFEEKDFEDIQIVRYQPLS